MSVPKQDRNRMDASIDEYAKRVVASAPPLTSEQLDQLSLIFHRNGDRQPYTAPKPAPRPTQIYRQFDKCGCLLYVGISYDAISRNYAHAGTSWWTKWVDRIQLDETTYASRSEATAAERESIRDEEPVFNTVHALDKRTSIIRYLIRHSRWEHLSVAASVDQRGKPDLLRTLDRAGLYDDIMWLKEPTAFVTDWKDPVVRRFVAKTETDENGCWRWQAHIAPNGYGTFRHEGTKWAHRVAYLLLRGPIPEGHDLRHTCLVKDCVNPSHLLPVPEDAARRTVFTMAELCDRNHPGSESRWMTRSDGRRQCRECNRAQAKRRRASETS